MKAALGNELLELAGTMGAGGQRPIRKFLNGLNNGSALSAFVFIDWHIVDFPP